MSSALHVLTKIISTRGFHQLSNSNLLNCLLFTTVKDKFWDTTQEIKCALMRTAYWAMDACLITFSRVWFGKKTLKGLLEQDSSDSLHLTSMLEHSYSCQVYLSKELSRGTCSPCSSIQMKSLKSKSEDMTSKSMPRDHSTGTKSTAKLSGN